MGVFRYAVIHSLAAIDTGNWPVQRYLKTVEKILSGGNLATCRFDQRRVIANTRQISCRWVNGFCGHTIDALDAIFTLCYGKLLHSLQAFCVDNAQLNTGRSISAQPQQELAAGSHWQCLVSIKGCGTHLYSAQQQASLLQTALQGHGTCL